MDASRTAMSERDLQLSVKAQALLRVKLGFPVQALMVLAVWFWGPPSIGAAEVAAVAVIYTAYSFVALYFAHKPRSFSAWELTLGTAILDPLMLSGWLLLMGHASAVFACFYLFTILGFGFRIGVLPMHICQCMSLAGFGLVVLSSPTWRAQPAIALSHTVLMVVVPLYASVLIKKLHAARALAEWESQAKSQLLANVSHELRTPLTGIVSTAQLIEAEASDSNVLQRAGSILKLSAALDAEINQLLDLAKHQSKLVRLEFESLDLTRVLEHLKLTLGPIAAIRNIGFAIRLDERIQRPVMGDAHGLNSILMNLAGNAIKFTEQGSVTVSVELLDDREAEYVVRLSVRDTGIGIPQEMQAKIFEPFFQVSSGTERRYGGTGLGTTIAKELVKLMGGELHLESTPGEGSLFWFELRMGKAAVPIVEAVAEEPTRIVYDKRILVADDHAGNLLLMKEMLAKDRHKVEAVPSGQEALERLGSMEFDAIFLDYNMADMDGARVFELYRFGRTVTAPTFFVTADTTRITTRKLLQLGATGVVYKPVTFEKLRAVLARQFQDGVETGEPGWQTSKKATTALKPVPVAYIDETAFEDIREANPAPEFLNTILSVGIADIQQLIKELSPLLEQANAKEVHVKAHALKGVTLLVGAVRLAALASRLMVISPDELRRSRQELNWDLEETARLSIDALSEVLARAA